MTLISIPNVSTADVTKVSALTTVVEETGARVLDVHLDAEHGRSVLTCTAGTESLIAAMGALAIEAASLVELHGHEGAHPWVGALDVCPFVPHEDEMATAITAARTTGRKIGAAGIPVFFYEAASDPPRSLPEIRADGLRGLMDRVAGGLEPDEGPRTIDPDTGVVCVGARDVLVAFNVWIDGHLETARRIASDIRGLPGVRALGLAVSAHGGSQISMNLIAPGETGIDRVFERIDVLAGTEGCGPVATEIVGLVPERFLPDPDATAARLLIEPGRSLEAALLI